MRAGTLRHRVTVEQPVRGRDAAGQPLTDWKRVAELWADLLHKNGAETIRADQDASTVQASIRIRYRTDLDASMRVVHGTKIYRITAVLPDERARQYVDLVCEVSGNGR
jgi:SPP1 family predicted phage head-tail adaptor